MVQEHVWLIYIFNLSTCSGSMFADLETCCSVEHVVQICSWSIVSQTCCRSMFDLETCYTVACWWNTLLEYCNQTCSWSIVIKHAPGACSLGPWSQMFLIENTYKSNTLLYHMVQYHTMKVTGSHTLLSVRFWQGNYGTIWYCTIISLPKSHRQKRMVT